MTVDEAIEIYKRVHAIPSACHLNWLKENFNPILKGIDNDIHINWACSTCVRNYMNMLVGWKDREEKKKANEVIKKPKSVTKKRKKISKKKS
jgi:hypothetical protein